MSSAPAGPIVGVGVVVLKATDDGPLVLLIRRGKAPRAGSWSIPGGRQELGETLKQAARREVLEETGVDLAELVFLDVVDSLTKDADGRLLQHYSLVDFLGVWRQGEPKAASDAADARWVSPAALETYDLWSETRRMIELAMARFSTAD
ncbi:MAG TPA: NUDIX hydrolase [Kiloniellaceae bacterium]|nr:NUDIX hydrolase [Kiloniellaceae bacterium]